MTDPDLGSEQTLFESATVLKMLEKNLDFTTVNTVLHTK